MKMTNPALAMGDILRAWTPFDGHPNVAGPKFRPVIFLGETVINGVTHWVVAYGTTRMQAGKESKSGTDFIIRCTNDSSMVMNSDTRFDFSKLFAIPATTEFFSANKRSTLARIAKIPQQDLPQAAACMAAAKVGQALGRLGVRL
ncbi:hypothetical protein [Massilia sp. LC238]|jgi:hypothetical protein|uniref:hypothetical protein n=1 Tax=Massilia sp. LC238 TaxID=1502852 RepID=UPI0004E44EA8|nr:hypothetical protein [Massilia sp. LC238]KFC72677.1 hypothetical protein FG94_01854 [Massilia sp. LC238]